MPLPRMPRSKILLLAVLFEGGMGLVAWLLGWLINTPPLAGCALSLVGLTIGAIATVPMLIGLVWVTVSRLPGVLHLNHLLDEGIVPMFGACTWFDLAAISASAGIGEEMLFRGFLQGWLTPRIGLIAAVVIASFLFGLMHYLSHSYFLYATLIGAYLGLLWSWTGDLLVPIAAHALYDFVALAWFVRFRKPPKDFEVGIEAGLTPLPASRTLDGATEYSLPNDGPCACRVACSSSQPWCSYRRTGQF